MAEKVITLTSQQVQLLGEAQMAVSQSREALVLQQTYNGIIAAQGLDKADIKKCDLGAKTLTIEVPDIAPKEEVA